MALHGLRLSLLATAMFFSIAIAQNSGLSEAKTCGSILTAVPKGVSAVLQVVPPVWDRGVQMLNCANNSEILYGEPEVRCVNGHWQPNPIHHSCHPPVCKDALGRRDKWNSTHQLSCECGHLLKNPCDQPGKVCGTDARTYESKCHLELTRCEEGRLIEVASTGPCQYGGVCALPQPSGDCSAHEKRWYYNLQRTRCEQFNYGQCFTGRNVFATKHECYKRCECDVWCKQPCDAGPCKHTSTTERFYFEPEIDTCKSMRYSECGGNENNFASHRDCMTACQYQRKSPAPSQTCMNQHNTTISQACGSHRNATTFLATISVDSIEVGRFGFSSGYVVTVGHKFFGNDRIAEDNQDYFVNLSERCPCLSLLQDQNYLVSGVVKKFGSSWRPAIYDGSLIMPYSSFVDVKAAVDGTTDCNDDRKR